MALNPKITVREFEKFRDSGDGKDAIAVVNPDGSVVGGSSSAATVYQGTNPWATSIPSGATVFQGTNPWLISMTSAATLYAVVNAGEAILSGNVTLNPSPNFIGLATAVIASAPTLYAVVNTGAAGVQNSLTTLLASDQWIGLVSTASINGTVVVPTYNGKTMNRTPIALSAINLSGATGLVAAASKKFYITNIMLSATSNVGVAFLNGPTYLNGNASIRIQLGPQGGFVRDGDPIGPIYTGLAVQTNFLIVTDTAAPVSGDIVWFEE